MKTTPAQAITKPNKFQLFLASIFRPLFGYKYKVVYTELEVGGSFQKRFMGKLLMSEPNEKILVNLPKINGCNYTTPIEIYYSKSDRRVNQRYQLGLKEHPKLVFDAYFK